MSINWSFNPDDYKENDFPIIPVGDHRVRIRDAEEKVSKAGNDMIVLTLDVSGCNSRLWEHIVFTRDNPQWVNQKLGQIYSSFGITPGDMNIENWKGKVGACRVKHGMHNGEKRAEVSYFLSKEKQAQLPAWAEPAGKASVTGDGGIGVPVDEEDLPF